MLLVLFADVGLAVPPVGCTTAEGARAVVLNELLPNAAGADGGQEWVEIHHPGAGDLTLDEWTIAAGTSELASSEPFPAVTLRAGGFLVVAASELAVAEVVAPGFTLGNAGSNADAVELRDCVGTVVDRIVYGSPNDDGWPDDDGDVATDLAPAPSEGTSIGRVPDGADGSLAADVLVLAEPTPGGPNEAGPECVPSSGEVVINEILPDAEGADEGWEFVELFHRGAAPWSLAGWTLEVATSTFGAALAFGEGAAILPGAFHVAGGAEVSGADTQWDASLGNGTGTDGVRLLDCAGAVVDTVLYGEASNVDLLSDDLGRAGGSYGDPGEGVALARVVDGADSDLAGDWRLEPRPTPGASNVPDEQPDIAVAAAEGCGGPDPPRGPGEGCASVGNSLAGLRFAEGLGSGPFGSFVAAGVACLRARRRHAEVVDRVAGRAAGGVRRRGLGRCVDERDVGRRVVHGRRDGHLPGGGGTAGRRRVVQHLRRARRRRRAHGDAHGHDGPDGGGAARRDPPVRRFVRDGAGR